MENELIASFAYVINWFCVIRKKITLAHQQHHNVTTILLLTKVKIRLFKVHLHLS